MQTDSPWKEVLDEGKRYKWKLAFMRRLNVKASGRNVDRLIDFINWIFDLPDDLEDLFREKLKEQGGENLMPYITSFERSVHREGRKEGLEQGRLHMAKESVLEALEIRFDKVPQEVKEAIEQISSLEECKTLHQNAIRADTLDDFIRQLRETAAKSTTE